MKKYNKRKSSSLYFEIEFFEKLIQNKPDFVDALIPLAEAYTRAGYYSKGVEIDKRLVELRPNDGVVHYNLACSYSLLEKVDEAFETLKKAIDTGYNDFRYMDTDPDLACLREDHRYEEMISNLIKKKEVNNGKPRPV